MKYESIMLIDFSVFNKHIFHVDWITAEGPSEDQHLLQYCSRCFVSHSPLWQSLTFLSFVDILSQYKHVEKT